jgi:hypothetical protein
LPPWLGTMPIFLELPSLLSLTPSIHPSIQPALEPLRYLIINQEWRRLGTTCCTFSFRRWFLRVMSKGFWKQGFHN